MIDNNQQAFLALVRAGLWEQEVNLSIYGNIDFQEILRLADEQSVIGLVTAGLDHVADVKVPKDIVLQFVGQAIQLEQQNKAMNGFIATLIDEMRNADIYSILLKGQGIAQCYEKPLWRACGDVDLLLSDTNYEKAKAYLFSVAAPIEKEIISEKHLAMQVDGWTVELHGTFRSQLLAKMDKGIDDVQKDIFCGGNVRSWHNGKTTIFLPGIDNDIVLVFTHIVKHFFHGGIGLRQICDECRLLWKYNELVDKKLLKRRLESMGLMTEWITFASLAVNFLGMPEDVFPFFNPSKKWSGKAYRIMEIIIEAGNFGHNKDKSYYKKTSFFMRKSISLWLHTKDSYKVFCVFPLDTIKVLFNIIVLGLKDICHVS